MTRYDALSALAGGWLVLAGTTVAILTAWCAIGITRWVVTEYRAARHPARPDERHRLRREPSAAQLAHMHAIERAERAWVEDVTDESWWVR